MLSKLLLPLMTVLFFCSPASAFFGKKGGEKCGSKYQCKNKKGDEKVKCWSERKACSEANQAKRLEMLKAMPAKKLAKRKPEIVGKMKERIAKSEERLGKHTKKLEDLKARQSKLSGPAATKMQEKLDMKTKHLEHMKERIESLKKSLADVEAVEGKS